MAIKGLLTLLVFALIAAAIGGFVLAGYNTARGRKAQPGIILAVVGIVGVLIVAPLNAGLVLIQPNEMGVVFNQTSRGTLSLGEPLPSGLSWVVPFRDQVIIYNVGQQNITMGEGEDTQSLGHGPVRAVSKDGQTINLDVTVIYTLDPTKVNLIHRNWQQTYADGFIVPQVRSLVRNSTTQYSAEELYSGARSTLESDIAGQLDEAFAEQGFLLTDLLIRDITFSPEFTQAIEQKQIAQQQAEQAAFRVQQALQEAEQARVEAQGKADSAVIAAQGEAEGITIKAEAQAKALDVINEILVKNPNLIQWQYINQLGDQVRLIIIPSNSPFLFNLQDLLAQAGAQSSSGQALPEPQP
jgi:regulator of protease activity HflC (stomatin/prohibitin superfamily)